MLDAGGRPIFDDRASSAVMPASVQKLVVADAALTQLGPDYRFDTIFAASKPARNGRINGNLWLGMSGDPSLRSRDIRAGAEALRASGIAEISGGIVVDPSSIAGEEINPLWNPQDENEDFMAATSGASLDEDTIEFVVTGTHPGEPAAVRLHPQTDFVRYGGSVTTGAGDDVTIGGLGRPNRFWLSGGVPPGVREKFWLPVHGVPQYVSAVADSLVRRAGIALSQPPQTGTVPLDAGVLWEHRSATLPRLLRHMLVFSDNHYAEQLMRTLGGSSGGEADDAHGLLDERRVLALQAIPVPGLHLVDGSGLAHANRVTARTLAAILHHFDAQPKGNALYPLLARGGRDGTLKTYDFSDAMGRVRAKSGHLDGASSLAGYVESRSHGRLTFVFMINGSPGDPDPAFVRAVDAIARQ